TNSNWCSGTCPATGTPTFNAPGTKCSWYGVTCDGTQSHVIEIALSSNNLVGTLPSLTTLTSLITFNASLNQLTGAIPALAGMASLQGFFVSNNQLTGNIPDLTGLASLSAFAVTGNQL